MRTHKLIKQEPSIINDRNDKTTTMRFVVSGIVPTCSVRAELGPPRTECAVGALMQWLDKLYVVPYVSSGSKSGKGVGLYIIDENLKSVSRRKSVLGTFTNRMVHVPSNQLIIGPLIIDEKGRIKDIEAFYNFRICSTMSHLGDPKNKVYALGMEGEFFEVDVYNLNVRQIADLKKELGISASRWPHFKAGYTAFGRVVVASNTYDKIDFSSPESSAGRLAEWDGKQWRILERTAFYEVNGLGEFSGTMFATGADKASAILKVFTRSDSVWRTYRLSMASHTFDHGWSTEWPRIRQTEHERLLMDCHGMFYELCPWAYENYIWGVRPISTHLWVIGDFCTYRGMLVIGIDNASTESSYNLQCAGPQSGLWFGKTEDLWNFGKPSGWGGPWRETKVKANQPSDPYLMTGFDKKVVHLTHDAQTSVRFTVEVDFLGNGKWYTYERFVIPRGGYVHHEFPDGFSAHWIRVSASQACCATAWFTYT